MTTDHEMAMRVHVALGGPPDAWPFGEWRRMSAEIDGSRERAIANLVKIGRELDKASRRDVAAEVVAAGEVSR